MSKTKPDQLLIGEEDVQSITHPVLPPHISDVPIIIAPTAPVLPVQTQEPPKTSYMIQLALEKGAGIEVIERLWALQKEIDAQAAKQEYHAAMSHVQGQIKAVLANLDNSQTQSKYPSYKALDDAVRPFYTTAGLSVSFGTGETPIPDAIRVICYISHSGGHTEERYIDEPLPIKGPKGGDVMTRTHATNAAVTYGQSKLLRMVFNIPVFGANEDMDGNAISDEVFDDDAATGPHNMQEALDWISNANSVNELTKIYLPLYQKAQDAKNKPAMQQLLSAKAKRQRELAQ